jgi:hypothetical protein
MIKKYARERDREGNKGALDCWSRGVGWSAPPVENSGKGCVPPSRQPTARLITEADTAHLLGMTPCTFSRKASQLEDELGMPRRHPILKRRDRVALNDWLDNIYSVGRKPTTVSELVRKRMAELSDG